MSANLKSTVLSLALSGLVGGTFVGTAQEVQADGSTYQAKNMFVFGNPADLVAGAATLTRTSKGISFRVYTSGLPANEAHTVWIVIFNKPQNCANGPGHCIGPDLGNPAVHGSIVYGTGYIVGSDGIGNFHGSLEEGSPPDGIQVNVPAGLANGLKNAKKAEIHLVVRSHGATKDDGGAVAQLTTFENGCGVCGDRQAVIFKAVD